MPTPMSSDPITEFPSLLSDEEIDVARAARKRALHDQYRRKERPDPWPLVAHAFPRIAAKIRDLWGQPILDQYLEQLVVDDRGGREGFPPDVLSAILEIARLHGERFKFSRPMCPWEADVSQSKWWSKA